MTAATGFARAVIDEEALPEVTGIAIRIHVVPQRGAADLNGITEDAFDFSGQSLALRLRQFSGRFSRSDAGMEQGFARVNIAYADDMRRVHDEDLRGYFAATTAAIQMRPVEVLGERFWA